jgi:uncharacterized protein (UPF0333 family)
MQEFSKKTELHNQAGVALPVSLIILLVLTILGVSGLQMARSQLEMTGYEQFYAMALRAAENAVEDALVNQVNSDTMPVTTDAGINFDTNIQGQTTRQYLMRGPIPSGGASLANNQFAAYHFEVQGTGTAPANTQTTVVQGVYTIARGGN